MYPRLRVNLSHLRHNVKTMLRLCAAQGIEPTAITKVFRADPTIAAALIEAGITRLGDSRVSNLARMQELKAEKWLIRPPMLSEVPALVTYADASLNSELSVIRQIDREALSQGKQHRIILMADLGDIREGFVDYDELVAVAKEVAGMQGAVLYGLGVNLTCFSFVQSSTEKLALLTALSARITQETGVTLAVLSGGNSATVDLMLQGGLPSGINNLRLGESILFGKERAKYRFLSDTFQDVFTLECEIVECKEKPSLPWGEIGVDSYGKTPSFVDRGPQRRKAVCALGKQDFDVETSTPCDPNVLLLGASSDHLMLDVTDCTHRYQVGDSIALQLGYFSTLRAFTSADVEKTYEE